MLGLCRGLYRQMEAQGIDADKLRTLTGLLREAAKGGHLRPDRFGISPVVHNLYTSHALCNRVSPDINMVAAIMLRNLVECDFISMADVRAQWGDDVANSSAVSATSPSSIRVRWPWRATTSAGF